jgi:hypothetical protein
VFFHGGGAEIEVVCSTWCRDVQNCDLLFMFHAVCASFAGLNGAVASVLLPGYVCAYLLQPFARAFLACCYPDIRLSCTTLASSWYGSWRLDTNVRRFACGEKSARLDRKHLKKTEDVILEQLCRSKHLLPSTNTPSSS